MKIVGLPLKWLRELYDWILKWADHPQGTKALCALAFVESIFFPIPVDPFIMAMGAARPRKALLFSLYATLFSLLGAVVGYYVGVYFWDVTSDLFFKYIFAQDKFSIVVEKFQSNTFITMFLAAFTPIPFKVFTLTAGATGVSLPLFIGGAALGRSMRFFLIGGALYFFGPQIRDAVDKYFNLITIVISLLLVLGYFVYRGL